MPGSTSTPSPHPGDSSPTNYWPLWQAGAASRPSQRSLHNAPIFRLLLKVAVNGMHQCDFLNFCGALGLQLNLANIGTPPQDPGRRASAALHPESATRDWAPLAATRCPDDCAPRGTTLGLTHWTNSTALGHCSAYLLGLLAMIKCSICSYQCDNWYVSNWRLACHIIFARGGCLPGLPGAPQMSPWHGTLLWATHPHG